MRNCTVPHFICQGLIKPLTPLIVSLTLAHALSLLAGVLELVLFRFFWGRWRGQTIP